MDAAAKGRIEAISTNAENKVKEGARNTVPRYKTWATRSENVIVPTAPIFIASSEDIGTNRVRANHFDAAIDYCDEQIELKKANAPLV
jgi:hypothetical protein